jgi:hypothetical protein
VTKQGFLCRLFLTLPINLFSLRRWDKLLTQSFSLLHFFFICFVLQMYILSGYRCWRICLLFTIQHLFETRKFIRWKARSWRTECPVILAACHKLGQDDHVCSLHELNTRASVGERQGRRKAFLDFLCIWTDKEQVLFILNPLQITASTKPLSRRIKSWLNW